MARGARGAPTDDGGRGRGPRVPSGPGFAMTIAFAAGLAAAALAFVTAFLVGAATASDPAAAMDVAGVQAARMLAAPGVERWRGDFGSGAAVRARVNEFLTAKLNEDKDDRVKGARQAAIDEFRAGKNEGGVKWKPGLDMVFPPNDPNDQLAAGAIKAALQTVSAAAPGGLVAVAVRDNAGTPLSSGGGNTLWDLTRANYQTLGETIYGPVADGVRQYQHPLRNRAGVVEGTAVIALSSAGLPVPNPVATAGAAAGAAFLGAFVIAFVMGLAPVKAMRKLALDADAAAGGALDTRITVSGPDVVQAAARAVQRLTQLAASGAAAPPAEPQIVEQQVIVQPVAEVQEGLAPMRSFKRPDEFEIEATQKTCPDLGNDYYDLVNVDDDRVGIFVADIPNLRGVRGALYMAQLRAIFRAVSPREQSPAEVLKLLNRAFAVDLPRGTYATAMYCVIDRTTGVCRVASAQHLPLVFWKIAKKASARLAPEGIALGLDTGSVFDKTIVEKAIQLDKGDRIVLFTDGAINARNLSGAQYGDERFYYVVNREAPKNSAACVNFIANDVDLFHEGAQQADDFTVVTLRRMK